jgi:hypothetical protein
VFKNSTQSSKKAKKRSLYCHACSLMKPVASRGLFLILSASLSNKKMWKAFILRGFVNLPTLHFCLVFVAIIFFIAPTTANKQNKTPFFGV